MHPVRERRDKIWEMMTRGIAPSKMVEILGVAQATVNADIHLLRRQLLDLGLRLGDWVEIKLTSSTFLCGHGKSGVLTQICLTDGSVAVDFDPFREYKEGCREQLFRISDVRKLNEMEVLAKVSQ